jgi:hypothetical protein
VRAKRGLPRRRELRRLMTTRRKTIWTAAQRHGWDRSRRRLRFDRPRSDKPSRATERRPAACLG